MRRVKLAEIAAMDATAERDQAEAEAAECRKQAERMLEITEQLADKNSSLTSQQEALKLKVWFYFLYLVISYHVFLSLSCTRIRCYC